MPGAHSTIRELVPLLCMSDIERSIAFYRDRLGFEVVNTARTPDGKIIWCRVEREGSAIMFQQAEAEDGPAAGRGRGVFFYFICDDADAMHAELSRRGLSPAAPTVAYYGMKQVFVTDPDEYELCFESSTDSPEG